MSACLFKQICIKHVDLPRNVVLVPLCEQNIILPSNLLINLQLICPSCNGDTDASVAHARRAAQCDNQGVTDTKGQEGCDLKDYPVKIKAKRRLKTKHECSHH